MAENVTILNVFVASPSDVAEDRECLEETIRELNKLWKNSSRVRLELVRWETDSYPDIGDEGQAVISEQIGDDYDIFIGILWKHFGLPTLRANSGTEEEFLNAYERFKKDPKQLRIMFYFKETKVDMTDLDLDQLKKIRDFRKRIRKLGTYDWSYKDKHEFSRYLRLHLTRQVEEWGKKWGSVSGFAVRPAINGSQEQQKDLEVAQESVIQEEEGILDLVEIACDSFAALTESSERIVALTEALGRDMDKRTAEITEANKDAGTGDVKKIKRLCNQAAADLEVFTRRMEAEVPLFKDNLYQGLDAYAKTGSLLPEFGAKEKENVEELEGARQTLSEMHDSLSEVIPKVVEFRETIVKIPRITTRYNRAKRKVLAIIDEYIVDLKSGDAQILETITSFDQLIQAVKGQNT